jgi:hypothetical protein
VARERVSPLAGVGATTRERIRLRWRRARKAGAGAAPRKAQCSGGSTG